ncbi:hypothetical protein [Planktothrix paucivesiculata]|uniref:Uncharacterized protein n=1 Tax=Planktothrix paucivesiculata PCC 9631 TaxID=671071 RepID=A0A7Z9BP38_9CYAN|nr:hypothetical protein [Planktothrix paucivesiculata]VXD19365.1 conserved hypothetical protein [Planktothrix paucivesiculata PCC 9631]
MNVQKGQIQALITEIDEVLSQPNLRLPWVVFGETVTRSRQVLERVRKYLIFLTEQADEEAPLSPMETNQPSISPGTREPLWQAIRREMIYLRSHLTQPLQDEIDHLRTEQRNLIQEIQQLEARKAQALGQVSPQPYQQQLSREFLQEFMTRLQDSLIHNVTETLNHIETRFLDSVLLTETPSLPPSERFDTPPASLSNLTPAQRLEQMRQLQAQSDHLLMTLDSSLSVIFEALQRNLQTYSDSLGQSLERMHSLGKQGEVMFTTLINQLAQQVGQETSSYLQSSLQLTESETPSKTADLPSPESVVSPPRDFSSAFEGFFPYAGAEVPRQRNSTIPADRDLPEEQQFKISDEFQVESKENVPLSSAASTQDGLDIMPEESLSLDWDDSDQSMVEPSAPDSELESLFDLATPTESPGIATTQTQDGDLFGDDFDVIQVLEQGNDISNEIKESATVENDTELDLDPEDLFADLEIETTKIEPLESENIDTESFDETAGFLSLNSLDIFSQPDQIVPIESDFSLTADVLDPVSLESENLFTPEVELVSPLIDEITDSSFAYTPNPFEETLADLSDVFEEPTFEAVPSPNSGVVSARTQQELTGIASPMVSSPDPIENKTVNVEKDIYIQASPDENLLPIDLSADSEQVDSRLLIDRNTLEHLEADLFNLEQPETTQIPKQTSIKSTPSQPQFTLQNSPQKAVIKVAQPEETITFEDLFRDLGMEPSSAQSVPSFSLESRNQPAAEKQNTSTTGLSDLTLDDVFNSFNLSEEESLNWDTEQEGDSLNLEALSQEFFKN